MKLNDMLFWLLVGSIALLAGLTLLAHTKAPSKISSDVQTDTPAPRDQQNASTVSQVIGMFFALLSGLALGGLAALGTLMLYHGVGLREIGRAPEGRVWSSSGNEYGHVSGAVFIFLAFVLGIGATYVQYFIVARTPGARHGEDFSWGCLPVVAGFILGAILLYSTEFFSFE
jgi:hypothetical protein